ncbi:phage baseplate protein [Chryseobacterium sp. 2R14A]|uniref:phage baseplate protein n=1 Tax=Chryseobacterium sp. 2R14A TaxID=3380353 RepID=UPI003CE9ECDB
MRYNFNFLQTGGVPLTNDLMSLIEEAYGIFEALGDLAGNLTILSGGEIVGSSVNPGIVAIEGKLYYFEGGQISSTVYIHTEEIQKTFQDTSTKTLIYKKTVKFGTGSVTSYNWSDFVKLETLKAIQVKVNNSVSITEHNLLKSRVEVLELKTAPIINGGIAWAWFKPVSEIPVGWKECLSIRGKTIVGLDPNDPTFSTLGSNIGEKTHKLTISEIPSHDHDVYGVDNNAIPNGSNSNEVANVENNSPFSRKTSKVGGDQPHNNIQPSTIAYFIEPNF